MKKINSKILAVLCAAEACLILCLSIVVISFTNGPPPVDVSGSSDLYARPDLSETVWPEEKQPFLSNSQYREREALFMRFGSAPVDLCCLGDSITQKFEWQDAFPDRRVANRGIGSDTTEGILARLDSVVRLEPKVISLMAGINDVAQGRTPDEIEATYRSLLEELRLRLPDTEVIVSGLLPVTAAHPIQAADILAVNERLEALCAEEDVSYLDLFSAFAGENGCLLPEYALDYVHLSPQGYALWLSYLTPALEG